MNCQLTDFQGNKIFFTTLSLSREVATLTRQHELLTQKPIADLMIKCLIFMIEKYGLKLYGFVILADQMHLVLSIPEGREKEMMIQLKSVSSEQILYNLARQKRNASLVGSETTERFPDQLFSLKPDAFWTGTGDLLPLQFLRKPAKLEEITSKLLLEYLADSTRNYMHLGVSAFTSLMLEVL